MSHVRNRRVKATTVRNRVAKARPTASPAEVLASRPSEAWSRRRAVNWLENIQVTLDLARDELFFGRGPRFGESLTAAERQHLAETLEAAQVAICNATPAHDDSFRPRPIG